MTNRVSRSPHGRHQTPSTYNVFGSSPGSASGTHRFAKAPFSVFHPVKRIIRAFWGKLDTAGTSLASDEKRSMDLRHGIVPQLLFSGKFGGSPRRGVCSAAVMG